MIIPLAQKLFCFLVPDIRLLSELDKFCIYDKFFKLVDNEALLAL